MEKEKEKETNNRIGHKTHFSAIKWGYSNRIAIYVLVMLFGVMLRTFVTHSTTIVWIVNLIGLMLFFFPYCRYTNRHLVACSTLYIVCNALTIAMNSKYLTSNVKGIGTNINIIVFPILLTVVFSKKRKDSIEKKELIELLRFISVMGMLSIVVAWVMGYSDLLHVFQGMNAYRANVSGLFYGKNIYGAFVTLSFAADILLLSLGIDQKRFRIFAVIKILAVILSFSRAALLLMGIISFVFIWTKKKRTVKDYTVLFGIIGTILVVLYIVLNNQNLYNFLLRSVLRLHVGDAGRESLSRIAIEKVNGNTVSILFGVGFAGIERLNIDIDNTYLYLWFSGGIIKLAIYLGVAILSYKRIKVVSNHHESIGRVCLAVFIGYLFFAFFESVAILELGLLNFCFTLFMIIIPYSAKCDDLISKGSKE